MNSVDTLYGDLFESEETDVPSFLGSTVQEVIKLFKKYKNVNNKNLNINQIFVYINEMWYKMIDKEEVHLLDENLNEINAKYISLVDMYNLNLNYLR